MYNYRESRTNWKFQKELGSGAFGKVEQWTNISTGKSVAIKRYTGNPAYLGRDEEKKLKARWEKESELTKNIDNPNIVRMCSDQCRDLVDEQNVASMLSVIAMEYCDGGNLRQKLHQIDNVNGFSEHDVREVLKAVSNAIHHLHKCKVTHRDIKPDNIVIKIGNDGKPIYKLTDMGYARVLDNTTIVASMVGSPNYFPPEIVDPAGYKNTVDYWAMAIVAFEIICGVHPFLQDETVYNVLNSIKKKTSKCIAITMSNNGSLCYHDHLFAENRLSVVFQNLIEPWLQLALEKDGRERGYEKGELKFYKKLNEALNKRIFTVFWVNRCKFLSYPVDSSTTMESLFNAMELDTGVNRADFYFAFPAGHTLSSLSWQVQPLQLYEAEFAVEDRSMLYLVDFKTKQLCDPDAPFISKHMQDIFSTNKEWEPKILKKYILNLLFVHYNERRRIIEFCNGIHEYAMNLENEMMYQEMYIKGFQEKIISFNGKASQFETMVAMGKQCLEEKCVANGELIANEGETIAQNFRNLFVEYLNINIQHKAVLKKIRDFLRELQSTESPLAKYKENVERCVKKYEIFFEELRTESCRRPTSENLKNLTSSFLIERHTFFENVKRWLRKSTSIDSIFEIHTEFINIMKTISKNQLLLNESENRMREKTQEYMQKFSEACSQGLENLTNRMDTLHLDNGQNQPSLPYNNVEIYMDTSIADLVNDSRNITQALRSLWD